MYEKRDYRKLFKGDNLEFFNVCISETDLSIGISIGAKGDTLYNININNNNIKNTNVVNINLYRVVSETVKRYRNVIEDYIEKYPEFLSSLEPISPEKTCTPIISQMCEAAKKANVGPMAAVAGAIAEMVGHELLKYCDEVLVENGGDLFIKTNSIRKVGIYAGKSPLNEKIALKISPSQNPIGICTSSGTVGHSLSFGKADAAVIVSNDIFLADAVATSMGNRVQKSGDIEDALKYASKIDGIRGAIIIIEDRVGAWGDIELTSF